jgi:hypothetical protein
MQWSACWTVCLRRDELVLPGRVLRVVKPIRVVGRRMGALGSCYERRLFAWAILDWFVAATS